MNNIDGYYRILELRPGASQAEVKHAYRNLAKRWHPDRFADNPQLRQQAEERFRNISEAYQQLKDRQPVVGQSSASETAFRQTSRTEVSSRPSGAEVFYNQGAENVKAGRYKEALEDFSTAIRLNPDYAEAYRFRGFVNSLLGFELGAEADLRKAELLGLGRKVSFTPKQRESKRRWF